jgi:mannose-6-phosphate isomerase
MGAIRLTTRRVEKPWGRRDLLPQFGAVPAGDAPVGEIWFEDPRGGEPPVLLVKYLFTSERLSIQVHPDDMLARARGRDRGKEEAWVVLEAEPDAEIGIGLCEPVDRVRLRAAALDGSIVDLVDWRPAAAGDYYYSPAGTVHALGGGLKLIEVQQHADLTYRLYDYGRPRELHVDDAVEAADPIPYAPPFEPYAQAPGRLILAAGRKFVLERWRGAHRTQLLSFGRPIWLIPVAGAVRLDPDLLEPGTVWLLEGGGKLVLDADADLLIAYPGGEVRTDFNL